MDYNVGEYYTELTEWLENHLLSICNAADPVILSKYVIALIQKPPELTTPGEVEKALRVKCLKQLEIFLQHETGPFVDLLFDVLKNKSFLDRLPAKSSVTGASAKPKKGAGKSSTSGSIQGKSDGSSSSGKRTKGGEKKVPESGVGQVASSSPSTLEGGLIPAWSPVDYHVVDSSGGRALDSTSQVAQPSLVESSSLVSSDSKASTTSSQPLVSSSSVASSASASTGSSLSSFIGSSFASTSHSVPAVHSSSSSNSTLSSVHPIRISINMPSTLSLVSDSHFSHDGSPQPSSAASGTVDKSGTVGSSGFGSQSRVQSGAGQQQASSRGDAHSASRSSSTTKGGYVPSSRRTPGSRSRSRSYSSSDSHSSSSSSSSSSPGPGSRCHRGASGRVSSRTDSPSTGGGRDRGTSHRYGNQITISSTNRSKAGGYGSHGGGHDSGYRSSRSDRGGGREHHHHRDHSPVSSTRSSANHGRSSGRVLSLTSQEGVPNSELPLRYQIHGGHPRGASGRAEDALRSRRELGGGSQGRSASSRSNAGSSQTGGRRGNSRDRETSSSSSRYKTYDNQGPGSTLIDYEALATQYAKSMQSVQTTGDLAGVDTTTEGMCQSSAQAGDPGAASVDEHHSGSSKYEPASGKSDPHASTPPDHSCPETLEKGVCEKGLYCLHKPAPMQPSQGQAGGGGKASNQQAQPPPGAVPFFATINEPYNPEAALFDPSMLVHMLPPGFINPMNAPPPMVSRFLRPALGPDGAQDHGADDQSGGGGGGILLHSLKSLRSKLTHGPGGGMQQLPGGNLGGGGGRPRELVGVSLSGGEPYVPRSLRPNDRSGPKGEKGGRGGGGGNNVSSGGYNNYRGGGGSNNNHNQSNQSRRPNVIDIMDRVNPGLNGPPEKQYHGRNNNYHHGGRGYAHHGKSVGGSEIYVPGGGGGNSSQDERDEQRCNDNEDSEEAREGAEKGSHQGSGSGGESGVIPSVFDKCWLVLRKVPPKLNTIGHLNNHFIKYGKVTNIMVGYGGDPECALVQFSNPFEATAAIRNTDAVFNNRFIRVFWANNEFNRGSGKNGQQNQQNANAQARGGNSGFNANNRNNTNKPWMNRGQHANQHQQNQQQQFANQDGPGSMASEGENASPFDSEAQQPKQSIQQRLGGGSKFFRQVSRTSFSEDGTSLASGQPPAIVSGPPVKMISPAERKARFAELAEKNKRMQEALTNQKHLMGKLEAAKTPQAKAAILKLLNIVMGNVKTLKAEVEKTSSEMAPALRTSKLYNKTNKVAVKEEGTTTTGASSSEAKSPEIAGQKRRASQDLLAALRLEEELAASKRSRLFKMDSTESVESTCNVEGEEGERTSTSSSSTTKLLKTDEDLSMDCSQSAPITSTVGPEISVKKTESDAE